MADLRIVRAKGIRTYPDGHTEPYSIDVFYVPSWVTDEQVNKVVANVASGMKTNSPIDRDLITSGIMDLPIPMPTTTVSAQTTSNGSITYNVKDKTFLEDKICRATATKDQLEATGYSNMYGAISNAALSGELFQAPSPSFALQTVIDQTATQASTPVGATINQNSVQLEAVQAYPQPDLAKDNLTAALLGMPEIPDLSSITKLKTVSDPAYVQGEDFIKTKQIDGPGINPYANINPNNKADDNELYEIIGGSDLSVFLVMEVPLSEDLDLPTDAQRKDILTIEMDNVLSLGYSTVRERYPVRVLGESNPRTYTRGSRTIAGHLAFNVFTKDVLQYLRSRVSQEMQVINSNITGQKLTESQNDQILRDGNTYYEVNNRITNKVQLLDDLPPFHILCMGTNENGIFSKFIIKNVSIVDENQYQGTQQPNIINKVSWVAGDIVPMNEVEGWSQTTVIVGSINSVESSYSRGNYNSKINYNNEVSGSRLLDDLNNSFGV